LEVIASANRKESIPACFLFKLVARVPEQIFVRPIDAREMKCVGKETGSQDWSILVGRCYGEINYRSRAIAGKISAGTPGVPKVAARGAVVGEGSESVAERISGTGYSTGRDGMAVAAGWI
jgi:hypothetical protein